MVSIDGLNRCSDNSSKLTQSLRTFVGRNPKTFQQTQIPSILRKNFDVGQDSTRVEERLKKSKQELRSKKSARQLRPKQSVNGPKWDRKVQSAASGEQKLMRKSDLMWEVVPAKASVPAVPQNFGRKSPIFLQKNVQKFVVKKTKMDADC